MPYIHLDVLYSTGTQNHLEGTVYFYKSLNANASF